MQTIILQPTVTAEWQTLIREAENSSHLQLSEELESYLTFLLVRFTRHSEMATSVLAFEYLHGMQAAGREQAELLRDVGDKCLLLSGFFPGRAAHKQVRISYFVDLGQGAYITLANLSKNKLAELYTSLCTDFVTLMDVLQAIREVAGETAALKVMEAEELWHDTASPRALTVLQRHTKAFPVSNKDKIKH